MDIRLRAWSEVQPLLVNEAVTNVPKINPMKELYWKQFGGGPDARLLEKMNPQKNSADESEDKPTNRKQRRNKNQQ